MNAPVDIPAWLDRTGKKLPPWTFTLLNTYRNVCAYQCLRRYIVKDIPYEATPAKDRGNRVHEALELRIKNGKPLPVDMHQYEPFARAFDGKNPKTEPKLAVTREGKPAEYFGQDVWGRGRADVLLVNETTAYLADWKSGKVKEDPFELEVQAVLVHAKYPQLKKIVGQFVWLAENRLGQLHDLSDTSAAWAQINHLVSLIENDMARGIFDKEPGPLCGGAWGSCAVKDCEFRK